MKHKLLLTGTALMLAAALTGCSNTPTANQPQSSQQQAAYISIEQAQETALDAANIDTADADISSATLSEVAGVTCYKVEFTSGDHAYSYSINAESGEVLEMSSREQSTSAASTDEDTQTVAPSAVPSADTSTAPAQTAPNTNTSTGAVDEAKAQEIALAHAGVSAADATITKSKLDYDDGRQVYEIISIHAPREGRDSKSEQISLHIFAKKAWIPDTFAQNAAFQSVLPLADRQKLLYLRCEPLRKFLRAFASHYKIIGSSGR